MSLFRRNLPTLQSQLPAFQREFEDLFQNFANRQEMYPKLEVTEDEKTYRVSAELPGLKEEDIHLSIHDNTLYIEGERKEETIKEGKGFTRSEFSYGSFCRTLPLTMKVDPEKVSAVYKNGVLGVTLEKLAGTPGNSRKIQIRKE